MSGGETQRASHEDMKDSLQTLVDEHSNYTAWLEGEQTNFTLKQEGSATIRLREVFLHPPLIPMAATSGYYNNITGRYKAEKIWFHNLTDPPEQVGWDSLAKEVYENKNSTLVHAAASGWNWTEPLDMSLSLFSYRSTFLLPGSPLFYRFRGNIELGPPNPERGLMAGPVINIQIEGVHIPHNGSLVGLAEPHTIAPDIRQLPALLPPDFVNASTHIVERQLMESIKNFERSIQIGASQLERDENPLTRCSFTFHGQMRPMPVHQEVIDEYERELQDPSGVPTQNLLQPNLDGVLMSEECGILLEFEAVTGIPSLRLNRRVVTYSAIASAVCYILIQLSLQMSDQWRTATSLHRGARGVVASWLIADSYAAISHLMAAVMSKEVRFAVLIPGFLGLVLLATDLRLLTYLNGVQMMFAQAQTPLLPAALTNSTPSDPPSGTNGTTPPAGTATSTASTLSSQSPSVSLSMISAHLFSNDFRAWLVVVGTFSATCMIIFNLPVYGVWFILISSTWSAQVIRNVYQRTRRVIRHDTIILSSLFRLFTPLYLFACPDNLLEIETASWIWIVPLWVTLQVAVLLGQDYLGPTFFLPALWGNGSRYDYHPDLIRPDEESVEPKLGDCSICMEHISSDQGHLASNRPMVLQLCWTQVPRRRRYAIAPCGHNFHTSCLEQWLDIKAVCPHCRSPLPPL